MRKFYVRPECDTGYGKGDGTSYANAWNGFKAVDWNILRAEPATLWVCGESVADAPTGFVTLHIEWSYLKANEREARPDPRRESPLAV
jgi:hypothetical protein